MTDQERLQPQLGRPNHKQLLFPDRAENLGQFSAYDVGLERWKSLSTVFRATFQAVYERGSPRMQALKEHVEDSHAGLARVLELPLPGPEMKEQIFRKNTNDLLDKVGRYALLLESI